MFCNGHNVRLRSRALFRHPRRKCTVDSGRQFYNNTPFSILFQFLFLPQLHASRAISGYSVPIVGCVIGGVGAILRRYGPESMGGVGDFGARIDAETARTGLSDEEISDKVSISISYISIQASPSYIQRYITIRKENWFKFLVFLQCMTTNFTLRRYEVLS